MKFCKEKRRKNVSAIDMESSLQLLDIHNLQSHSPKHSQSAITFPQRPSLPALYPAENWPQREWQTWVTCGSKGPLQWATSDHGLPVGLSVETPSGLHSSLRFSPAHPFSSSSFRSVRPSRSDGLLDSLPLQFADDPHHKCLALLVLPWHLLSRHHKLE